MAVFIDQLGINHYSVEGQVVSRLSTAIQIAKSAARELSELTGIDCRIVHNIYC